MFDLVPDTAKLRQRFLVAALESGRIIEGPEELVRHTGEDARTTFVRSPTDDDQIANGDFSKELGDMFRPAAGDVDAVLSHDPDGNGVHLRRGIGARTVNVEAISGEVLEIAFGNLAAARVPRAEDQDIWVGIHG